MADQSGVYEKVSKIVGDEMSKAFSNILKRAAEGNAQSFTDAKGGKLAPDELATWAAMLNGASMDVNFFCRETKGQGVSNFADVISPVRAIEGSISIGATIRF